MGGIHGRMRRHTVFVRSLGIDGRPTAELEVTLGAAETIEEIVQF